MVTKRFKILFLISWVLLLFVSCDDKKEMPAAPDHLLSETEMVDIVIDVQIMEQAINLRRGRNQNIYNLKTQGFQAIFSHYGITDSVFYENLDYYNANPEVMKRIMDSVSENFQRMQDERKKEDEDKQ